MLIVNLGEILTNTIFMFIVFNGIIILIVINNGQKMLKRILYVITLFILSTDIVTASDNVIQFLDNKNDEKLFKKNIINQIYMYPENKVIVVHDINLSENLIVYIDNLIVYHS